MGRVFKRKWMRTGVAALTFGMVFAILTAVYEYRELKSCKERQQVLEGQLQACQKVLYVAKEKIPKGTILTVDKVEQEVRYTDQPMEYFISSDDFGLSVNMDVAEGICLTDDMLCSSSQNVREIFVAEAEIAEHLQSGDRIDVRIRYGNAEDYIVLSDKRLLKCDSGAGMVLELSEREILMLSSAILDCRKYEKTRLYVVEYPEYQSMESGVVNYIATREILSMLGKENTEGKSRTALELRLEQAEK